MDRDDGWLSPDATESSCRDARRTSQALQTLAVTVKAEASRPARQNLIHESCLPAPLVARGQREQVDVGTEALELLKVGGGEVLQAAGAETCEVQANDSVVFLVDVSLDKAGPLGAVDELHGAVVTCQKMVGNVAHGGYAGLVTSDDEQQLMLGRSESCGQRLPAAPVQELAETVPKPQEPLVLLLGQRA